MLKEYSSSQLILMLNGAIAALNVCEMTAPLKKMWQLIGYKK
jgi:hypothetical protein